MEDAQHHCLTFSLLDNSAFMQEFVGSWHIQAAAPGAGGGRGSGLTEVRTASLLPVVWYMYVSQLGQSIYMSANWLLLRV